MQDTRQTIRPSTVLEMTLPLFDMLVVQGPANAKTVADIYANLLTLKKALVRIEKEYEETVKGSEQPHDAYDGQGQDV